MKRYFFFCFMILTLIMLSYAPVVDAKRSSKRNLIPDPKKYAALVMDADSGLILHEKNADRKRHPASLVKLMTLYLTFDAMQRGKLSMNQYLPVSRHAAIQPSLNIGLQRGEKIKVRDAIYALTVRSANDAAVVLAEAISGSEAKFAKLMTDRARRIGMYDTTFKNASGLHNKHQLTTAKDMAKLMIALQRDFPRYYRYMSRTGFMRKGHQYKTHNKVLMRYNGATGGKTGYISASGYNLVTMAKRRNHDLVAVVMGGKTSDSRDKIMMSLLDKGFDSLGRASESQLARVATIPPPVLKPWKDGPAMASSGHEPLTAKRRWTIELGGFGKEQEVISAVTNAMDIAPEQLAFSQINFVNRHENGLESHWARFVSLTEQQAKAACEALQSSDAFCQVIDEK